jgi:hypothetical protein
VFRTLRAAHVGQGPYEIHGGRRAHSIWPRRPCCATGAGLVGFRGLRLQMLVVAHRHFRGSGDGAEGAIIKGGAAPNHARGVDPAPALDGRPPFCGDASRPKATAGKPVPMSTPSISGGVDRGAVSSATIRGLR